MLPQLRARVGSLLLFLGLLGVLIGILATRGWVISTLLLLVGCAGVLWIHFALLEPLANQDSSADRAAREIAELANRAKTTFLASISHEIRTPLGGIIGMIELLAQTPLTSQQLGYLETLSTSCESLLSLLNDVIDISRIEADKLTLESVPFDPRQIAREAIRVLTAPVALKGLHLDCDLAPDLPERLVGDPTRLRQILLNLIGNAVKFTGAGEIHLRIRRGPGQQGIEFSISDTGIGIPADRLAAIFDPFEQGEGSTARTFGGTGLGLAISSRLVSQMGGTLKVTSEVGKGSTFSFILPLVEPPSERAEPIVKEVMPVVNEPRPRASHGRILIAEDNLVNTQVLLLRLEKAGFEVSVASNGREAVEQFEKGGIDLILMDMQMPEIDGPRAARLIRAREKVIGGRVPIVAVTANVLEGERQRCLSAGMDDYLRKPVRGPELLETIARLLHKPGLVEPGASADKDLPEAPGTDSTWLSALQGMNFGDEAIGRLVRAFVTTIPDRLIALEKAIETGDAAQVIQVGHAMKGSLQVFAAHAASDLSQQLERLGQQGRIHEAPPIVTGLRGLVEPLVKSMETYLKSHVSAPSP